MQPLRILQEVCSTPTAPFAEQYVVRVRREVRSRSRSSCYLAIPPAICSSMLRSKNKGPRWVFAAHMDHPGFVARRMIDAETLEADFRGWVRSITFKGEQVRFFGERRDRRNGQRSDGPGFTLGEDRKVPRTVRLRVRKPVAPGSPGMLDQGEGRVKGRQVLLAACATTSPAPPPRCTMLDQLVDKARRRRPSAVLLTRAEEEGFIGAIAAVARAETAAQNPTASSPSKPPRSSPTPRRARAPSSASATRPASSTPPSPTSSPSKPKQLAKKDKTFKYQRALMPGGTCEATVYDVYGFTAGSHLRRPGQLPQHGPRAKRKSAPSTSTWPTGKTW